MENKTKPTANAYAKALISRMFSLINCKHSKSEEHIIFCN